MKKLIPAGVVLAILFVGRPDVRTADAVSTVPFLDDYVRGGFDQAVAGAAAVKNAEDVGRALAREAPQWIAAEPERRERRRLAVAAFAAEFVHARLETDWRVLYPLLEWACVLLRNGGPPTEGERQWHLAVIALAGRARDFGRLDRRLPDWAAVESSGPQDLAALRANIARAGHLAHAFERFPDEPRVLLATATIAAAIFDGEPGRNPDPLAAQVFEFQRRGRMHSLVWLDALRRDPRLAAEAHMHAGHVHYALGSLQTALALEHSAEQSAIDPNTKYLAHFIAGRVLVAMKRPEEAAAEFERAIAVRPRAQSAAMVLAAIRATLPQSGAVDLLRPALDSHSPFDDPWRLYGYGDYIRWPETLAALREALK